MLKRTPVCSFRITLAKQPVSAGERGGGGDQRPQDKSGLFGVRDHEQ